MKTWNAHKICINPVAPRIPQNIEEAESLFSPASQTLTPQEISAGTPREILNPETDDALNEYYEMKNNPEKYSRYSSFKSAMLDVLSELPDEDDRLYEPILAGLEDAAAENTRLFSEAIKDIRRNRLRSSENDRTALRASIGAMPQDFMEDREQPSWDSVSEREAF